MWTHLAADETEPFEVSDVFSVAVGGDAEAIDVGIEVRRRGKECSPQRVALQEIVGQLIEGTVEVVVDGDVRPEDADEQLAVARRVAELENEVRLALLPKDAMDERDVILEVRAGTGGDEAALFAGDLFRMYERFAALQG